MADSPKTNRENIKLLKELIKEQSKLVKEQERGSKEYQNANNELKKLRAQLVGANKEFDKGKDIKRQHAEIQDRQYKRALEIRGLNVNLTKQAKRQASYAQTVESLGYSAGENLKNAVSLQNNLGSGGDLLSERYGMTATKLAEVGGHFEGIGTMQDEATRLSLEMAKAYDDIGTGTFDLSAMKSEIEELGQKAAAEREVLESMLHTVKDDSLKQNLLDEIKVLDDVVDGLKSKEESLTRVDKLTKAASTELTAPFEKLKSVIEGMPFGGFISEHMNLNGVIDNFGEMTRKSLAAAFDPANPMNMSMALKNIGTQGVKAAEGLAEGFKATNAFLGGMLGPALTIVAALMIAKKVVEMFYGGMLETRKEFGLTHIEAAELQNTLNTTAMEMKFLGVSAEDVKAGAQGIMDNLGGIGQITQSNVREMARLNALYGVSGESAGLLAGQMMAVGVSSVEGVGAQLDSVAALSQANGVAPAKIMEDVASNSEAFAGFAKDGGDNVFKAAIAARKLGLGMSEVSKISDHLLDFESSINAEMEASMLLGRSINMDKAREAALNGDLETQMKEITKQVGSQAEWESLNVVQRRSLAAAAGLEVSEMSKMIVNQEKLNNMTSAQKKRQDLIADVMKKIGEIWTRFLGIFKALIPLAIGLLSPFLAIAAVLVVVLGYFADIIGWLNEANVMGVGLGDVIMFAAGAALLFRTNLIGGGIMGTLTNMKDMIFSIGSKMKGVGKKMMGMGGGDKGGGIMDKLKSKGGGDKGGGKKGAGGGIGKGLGKGLKSAGTGIKSFGASVATLANPATLIGLAAITLAVIGLGFGFKMLGEGLGKAAPAIKAFMEGVGSIIKDVGTAIVNIMDGITTNIIRLSAIPFANLFQLGIGLASMGTGLGIMAIGALALIPALPVLFALNKMGILGGVSLGGGKEDTASKDEGNPVEIKLTETNMKLDNLIELLGQEGPIALATIQTKANTSKIASQII